MLSKSKDSKYRYRRWCRCCGKLFIPEGKYFRVCNKCKGKMYIARLNKRTKSGQRK